MPVSPVAADSDLRMQAALPGLAAFWFQQIEQWPLKYKLRISQSVAFMSNPVVFFDVSAGSQPLGRIEMTVRAERARVLSDTRARSY